MSKVTMHSHIVPTDGWELRTEEDDGALLYDPATGAVAILNMTAEAVWSLLDGRRTVADVTDALARRFEGMVPEAAEDVLATIQSFVDRGSASIVGE